MHSLEKRRWVGGRWSIRNIFEVREIFAEAGIFQWIYNFGVTFKHQSRKSTLAEPQTMSSSKIPIKTAPGALTMTTGRIKSIKLQHILKKWQENWGSSERTRKFHVRVGSCTHSAVRFSCRPSLAKWQFHNAITEWKYARRENFINNWGANWFFI